MTSSEVSFRISSCHILLLSYLKALSIQWSSHLKKNQEIIHFQQRTSIVLCAENLNIRFKFRHVVLEFYIAR